MSPAEETRVSDEGGGGILSAKRSAVLRRSDAARWAEDVEFGDATAERVWPRPIGIEAPEGLYVDEPFSLGVRFADAVITAEIVTLQVRFPSGLVRTLHFDVTPEARRTGVLTVDGFVSGESGELEVLAVVRDAEAGAHRLAQVFGVFTRNPVQMFVTPTQTTRSGRAGAPKFDYGARRWVCNASVRWVNGEQREVNLGRNVKVRMTDAGQEIGTFTFALSGDVVVPALSTVYGTWRTSHPEGSEAFQVFHAKGDLTFEYSMSGSGHTPRRSMIWRTMRVIGYNIIRVGDFTATERSEYRRAASDIASSILQSRDMTVHGVELYRIEGTPEMDADKDRFRFIDNQGEIDALRDAYSVDNWYIDTFFVESRWDGAFGSARRNGPVDKSQSGSGMVLRRDADTANLGQTFAHEAGHYLGLAHADEDDGCDDTDPGSATIDDNFIFSSSAWDSDVITGCQINKMRRHGLVRSATY